MTPRFVWKRHPCKAPQLIIGFLESSTPSTPQPDQSTRRDSHPAPLKHSHFRYNCKHEPNQISQDASRRGSSNCETVPPTAEAQNNNSSTLTKKTPNQLIHHTIQNFNIGPDKVAVARINDSLSTLQQARDLQRQEADSALKKLARQLGALQAQHAELVSSHSPADHSSEISRLDTQKFRTAKAASDLEMETERLSGRLADLGARLQELELQGVDGGAEGGRDAVEDEVLLRLRVYRSLGIDVERDERDGEFARAVVRNDRKGDVHVVNLDKKFSRFFYANYFWQTL